MLLRGYQVGVLGQAQILIQSFIKCVGLCSCTLAPSTSALGRPIHWACLNCDNSCCSCCCHVHQLLCTCCVHNKAPPTLHQIGVVKQIPHHTHPFFSSFIFHNCLSSCNHCSVANTSHQPATNYGKRIQCSKE